MPWTAHRHLGAFAGLGLLALSACAPQPPPMVMAYPAIPPLREEIRLAAPPEAERYVWQPGHWVWNGTGYSWNEGRWVLRPVLANAWEHGYWAMERGAWVWVPARWR